MNLRYMMIKDKYMFSPHAQLVLLDGEENKKRSEQISFFIKELVLYGSSLSLLCKSKPPSKVKNELLNIAFICTEDKQFYDQIKTHRKLPEKKLSAFTGRSKLYLDKWKDYILAYFLILSNKNYELLKDYLNIKLSRDDFQNDSEAPYEHISENFKRFSGLVLKISKNTIYIITSLGEFMKLELSGSDNPAIGNICTGALKKDLHYYRYPVIFGSLILIILIILLSYMYLRPSKTIIIDSSYSIKIKTNSLDKTVHVSALDSNGSKITGNSSLFNKSIDSSLYVIFNEAYTQNILTSNTPVTIYISGDSKNFPTLTQTSSFAEDKKLQIKINNNGIEQKLR